MTIFLALASAVQLNYDAGCICATCFNFTVDDQIVQIINCSAWLWHSVRSKDVAL